MNLSTIIIIGIGLAMDCFAVSTSKGICAKKFKWKYAFRMALLFGFFQGMMPLISFSAGYSYASDIRAFDHWIAFGLLALIGIKMLYEGFTQPVDPDCRLVKHPFRWKTLITLAFATSIDALATGVIFISQPEYIWQAVGLIGIISFIFSIFGFWLGVRFRKRFNFNVEVLGGLILIGIGIKILLEHLYITDKILS